MNFKEIIDSRMSTRSFSDRKISDEDLIYILECGRMAPTAKNLQPVKIKVCNTEESLNKVDKITMCRYKAPTCLIVCSNKEIAFSNDGYNSFELDGGIVLTHLVLGASSIGVDSCIVRMFNVNEVQNEFNLESNIIPVALIMLGYKTLDYEKSVNFHNRKDISEFVDFV